MLPLNYSYIEDEKNLEKALVLYKDAKIIAIDTETTGENPLDPKMGKIRLIQIATKDAPVLIIDWGKISLEGQKKVKAFLEKAENIVFHNAKFDMKFLKSAGIILRGKIFDTFLAAEILQAGLKNKSSRLDAILKGYLEIEISKEEQLSDWSNPTLSEAQLLYAAKDAYVLLELREALILELIQARLEKVARLEFDTVPALVDMELEGIKVNLTAVEDLIEEMKRKKIENMDEISKHLPDINLNSPPQLLKGLKGLDINLSSTKFEILIENVEKHKVIKSLIDYKNVNKKLQILEKLHNSVYKTNGRLYSNYFQMGTETGRLSCKNFNLQQVPNSQEFRECFIPDKGKNFVIADYSQIQIRIAAEITKDKEMIKAYKDNQDIHALTAALISGKDISEVTKDMRTAAKALNFGMLFGMGAKSFVEYSYTSYGVKLTESEAKEFIAKFFNSYSGLKKWQNLQSKDKKKETRTILGRRRLFSQTPKFTQIVNTPIQGTEADILKKSLSILHKILEPTSAKILACVHDEIILECDEKESQIIAHMLKVIMEEVGRTFLKEVPVLAEAQICKNWAGK